MEVGGNGFAVASNGFAVASSHVGTQNVLHSNMHQTQPHGLCFGQNTAAWAALTLTTYDHSS